MLDVVAVLAVDSNSNGTGLLCYKMKIVYGLASVGIIGKKFEYLLLPPRENRE